MPYNVHALENIAVHPLERTFHPHLIIDLDPTPPASLFESCAIVLDMSLPDALFIDRDELAAHFASQSVHAWALSPVNIDIERPVLFGSGLAMQSAEAMESADAMESAEEMQPAEAAMESVHAEARDGVFPGNVRLTLMIEHSGGVGAGAVDDAGDGVGDGAVDGVGLETGDFAAKAGTAKDTMQLDIPLHGRYLQPDDSGIQAIPLFGESGLGHLKGGWICADRLVPNIEFTVSRTLALPSISPSPQLTLLLPTGHRSHQPFVELVTALSIWLGFFYLAAKILRLTARLEHQRHVDKTD